MVTIEVKHMFIKEKLSILKEQYGVKMNFIAENVGLQTQNLHNFLKGKIGISENKTDLLVELLISKYGKLLDLEDK